MYTEEMIKDAIANRDEVKLDTSIYEAQFNMVQRLISNRRNMKNNTRRSQILAGHAKIIRVLNGFKL